VKNHRLPKKGDLVQVPGHLISWDGEEKDLISLSSQALSDEIDNQIIEDLISAMQATEKHK